MKIDIGNGKILGTKRVSPNGQISGFSEFAGREVLVILPDGDPEVQLDPREALDELREATVQHMRVAFREYEGLRENFKGPNEAAKAFLDARTPRSFKGLYEKVDAWVREQAEEAGSRVRRAIDRRDASPSADARADTEVSP